MTLVTMPGSRSLLRHVTERIVEEAAELGIEHIWIQPGAESDVAIARTEELAINVIHGGPCILVSLRYTEERAE